MSSTNRALLTAAVVAALIGFAAGWFARVWSEPTVESKMNEAAGSIREKVRELGR
jgi:Tfp pilus assembly protein FimT